MTQKTAFNQFLSNVKNHIYPNRMGKTLHNARIARQEGKFFKNVSGVIHVGAHTGEERDFYSRYDLDVLWIEPAPDVFKRLSNNIACYPKQKAVNYLITDQDNSDYDFHLSNNDGNSSSILGFKKHADIWPEIKMINTIKLKSRTLDSVIAEVPHRYDALVMDTQGSEMLVLKGAVDTLQSIRLIKTEAADFEIYEKCTTEADLCDYLGKLGFDLVMKTIFETSRGVGSCFDLIFSRPLG